MKLGHEKIHEDFLFIFNIFPGLWGQEAWYNWLLKLEEDYSFAPEEVEFLFVSDNGQFGTKGKAPFTKYKENKSWSSLGLSNLFRVNLEWTKKVVFSVPWHLQ